MFTLVSEINGHASRKAKLVSLTNLAPKHYSKLCKRIAPSSQASVKTKASNRILDRTHEAGRKIESMPSERVSWRPNPCIPCGSWSQLSHDPQETEAFLCLFVGGLLRPTARTIVKNSLVKTNFRFCFSSRSINQGRQLPHQT